MTNTSVAANRVHCPADQSEDQYNLAKAFPDYPQLREGWLVASAALRQRDGVKADLAYGDQPLQNLDYYPAGEPGKPLLIFVHGGYWQRGDKGDVGFIAKPYLDAGINVASINYSLAPDAPIEDMVTEVRQAISWLAGRAGELGFDAKRISLMGHSAGGHLVSMMVAQTGADAALLPAIVCVFGISGVYDLPPLLPSSVNHALGLDPARAEALSPIVYPGPASTSVYTFVGQGETQQFHEQADALGRAWPAVRLNHVVPDTDHFSILNVLADGSSPSSRVIIQAMLDGAP